MRVAIVFSEEIQSLIKPIVDARRQLFDEGITLGANLPRPDVRIIDNRLAVKELKENNGKLLIPSLVYEWADSAGIDSHSETRELLAHSDTLLWLKINKFKDPSLFNEPTIAGRLHFRFLNECSKFTIPSATPSINPVPITPEMVSKIRLLPAGIFDRFKPFREATVNVQPKRPIDVSFAGLVDYSIRDHDYWDENFARTKDDPSPTTRFFNDVHRRAAVTELTKLRHLRIVLGLNRVLQPDLYQAVLLRSSISVSPWGFGEYAWRDYESIFAGCILVKPDTDHVESFAPNIYQSGKYYYKCAPDFSDLADVIAHIMTHRKEALEIASAARQDLIAETAKEKIGSYYVKLLREAAGNRASEPHHLASALFGANQSFYPPVIVLGKSSSVATRAEAKPHLFPLAASSHERAWLLTEDHSASNTHDLRLVTNEVIGPGLYRLRFLMRAAARSHAVVQIHSRWENSALFHVDLHSAQIAGLEIKGTLLEFVEHPMCIRVDDNWIGGTSILRIVDFLDGCGVVVYAADGIDYKYTGDGRDSLAIGLLDLTRI